MNMLLIALDAQRIMINRNFIQLYRAFLCLLLHFPKLSLFCFTLVGIVRQLFPVKKLSTPNTHYRPRTECATDRNYLVKMAEYLAAKSQIVHREWNLPLRNLRKHQVSTNPVARNSVWWRSASVSRWWCFKLLLIYTFYIVLGIC